MPPFGGSRGDGVVTSGSREPCLSFISVDCSAKEPGVLDTSVRDE